MLAGVVVILKVVIGVLGISKIVKRAAKQIPLRLYILLRVEVLEKGKVSKRGVIRE